MGALDGIKVVEAGLLVQGPQAALTLQDWGASVVKVEMPGFGDQSRWLPISPEDFRSAWFAACNRGKRSCTIDLRKPEGKEAFLRLAESADVVITNFKPGTMEEWGLGYEDVAARNPRIIYAVGSSFGHRGADAHREGADLSAQAAGGIISTTGADGADLTPIGATIADHMASQNLVSGIVAALFQRERTGEGQRVETSLLAGQIWAQAADYTALLLSGNVLGRSNRGHPMIPGLYAIFPTADGWIAMVGVAGPARPVFYNAIGRPELEQQFSQLFYWNDTKSELWPILDEVFRTKTTAEWSAVFEEAGLRYAPVRDHAQVAADPAVWDNEYLVEVEGPEGPAKIVSSPVRFSATPAVLAAAVPELGQHTEEVLVEAGYTWEELAGLQDAGAI